jgi:hypothetical protein
MLHSNISVRIPKENKHSRGSFRRERIARHEDLAEIRAALSSGTSGISAFLVEVCQ